MFSNLFIKFGESIQHNDDGTVVAVGKDALILCEEADHVFKLDVKSHQDGADFAFIAVVKNLFHQTPGTPSSIPWERLEEYMQKYRMGFTLRMISYPENTYRIIIH